MADSQLLAAITQIVVQAIFVILTKKESSSAERLAIEPEATSRHLKSISTVVFGQIFVLFENI